MAKSRSKRPRAGSSRPPANGTQAANGQAEIAQGRAVFAEPSSSLAADAASPTFAGVAATTGVAVVVEDRASEVQLVELASDDDHAQDRSTFAPRSDVAEISAFLPHDDAAVESDDEERSRPAAPIDVDAELRAVEAEVDRIFHARAESEIRRRAEEPSALRSVVSKLREVLPVELPGEDGDALDAVKDVLSTDYYLRQWGRIGLRNRSEEVDEFGLDPIYEARLRPFFDLLYRHWFRVEVRGIENVPEGGRVILVANHSGVLPYDGIMVRTAVRRAHPAAREVRWLAEDFVYHLPFLGAFMNRIGAVRACQENAERLLRDERCVLVFPEGIKGIGKLYKDRYRLQRFGRGGYIKLALRTGAPIVPVAIVGAEESAPMLYRIEYLTQALGLPFVPVTPTFPALGPLGLVPAPSKWTVTFGPPIDLEGHGPEAAGDALLVGRLNERVRTWIQGTLDRRLAERKSVWFG
jgi:1-acyl-sn-glycerol-3-phosphate acyltransferase